MAFTHKIGQYYYASGVKVMNEEQSVTGEVEKNYDIAIAIATDASKAVALTIAKLQSFAMMSTVALTICTNAASGGSPQETIHLAANVPLIWGRTRDGAGKIPFAGNVTAFYCTAAAAGLLSIRAVADL